MMNIQIDRQAIEWLINELGLSAGDYVRFLVRYEEDETNSPLQPGYSLRLSLEAPSEPASRLEIDGIVLFVEQRDLWYFDEHDLIVMYNKQNNDIQFHYSKSTKMSRPSTTPHVKR